MVTRKLRVVCLGVWMLAMAACTEPYETAPMRVTSLFRVDNSLVNTFSYKSRQLVFFKQTAGSTSTSSEFIYKNGLPNEIITDSTEASYTLTQLLYQDSKIVGDSVFTVANNIKTKKINRAFEYDREGQLTKVALRTWAGDNFSDTEILLERTDGNVTKFETYAVTEAGKELTKSITLKYDDRKSVYPPDFVFFYTLSSSDLYWMSINNPVVISETDKKDLKSQFWYNQFDYPSNFKDGNGVGYGAAYTGIP